MVRKSNLVLFFLVFCMLVFSVSANDSDREDGNVSVYVEENVCEDGICDYDENCDICSFDCGVCPEFGESSEAIFYRLNFEEKIVYSNYAVLGNSYSLVWPNDQIYNFEIGSVNEDSITFANSDFDVEYQIGKNELTYFDLNVDGNDDVSVLYAENTYVVWTKLRDNVEGKSVPEFHKTGFPGDECVDWSLIPLNPWLIGIVLIGSFIVGFFLVKSKIFKAKKKR